MSEGKAPKRARRPQTYFAWTTAILGLTLIPHVIINAKRPPWPDGTIAIHVGALVSTIVLWCAARLGRRLDEHGTFGADDLRDAYREGRADARTTEIEKLLRRRRH